MKRLWRSGVAGMVLLTGCRFWYKPVPVANAIGEEKAVVAGDSLNVYREPRFEVYGPNAEAVYDGYEQLNRAYRSFERYFGPQAPRLAFILADSAVRVDNETARAFRNRGYTVVAYSRPRSVRSRRRYSGIDYGGVMWPIAPTAARAMLARVAETSRDQGAQRPDSAVLGRFPVWYRTAVIHLIGEGGVGGVAYDVEYLREKRHQWFPLRDLLTLVRPIEGDTLLDPARRGEADEMTRIVAAQSSTLGRFLAEREGPMVIGRIGRGYATGRRLEDMLAELQRVPRTVPALEDRWKLWVESVDY